MDYKKLTKIADSVNRTILHNLSHKVKDSEDELMMWDEGYDEDSLEGYEIVTWPDSQMVEEIPGYTSFAYLINDEEGLETYGSSAYVVDKDWYDENTK